MKWTLWAITAAALVDRSWGEISCRNAQGDAVDWYIGSKYPLIAGTSEVGKGFIYADREHPTWSLVEDITSDDCAISKTLAQYYQRVEDPDVFYIMFNDAYPDGKDDGYRGHTKGALLFDGESGFWLTHSVPRFPGNVSYSYPDTGLKYGQSFLCITFKTDALAELGEHFMYTMPSIYQSQLPLSFAARFPVLSNVIAKKPLASNVTDFVIYQKLASAKGPVSFHVFGKHKKFNADLYLDLVAPYTNCSFYVETWPNGAAVNYPTDCNTSSEHVSNILTLSMGSYQYTNTKDHSKWAVAEETPACGYLCVGDINRQMSQNDRAGGTICFQYLPLWKVYRQSVNEVEPCPV